jgi:ATP-dependent Lon protease
MAALSFGLEIDAPGQNVFVRGLTGTGRMTLVRRLLQDTTPICRPARDRCYVHNFTHPDRPRLIVLKHNSAAQFARRIDAVAAFVRDDLRTALSSQGIRARQTAIENAGSRAIDAVVKPFEEELREAGLGLVSVQVGPVAQAVLCPLVDGKPLPPDQLDALRQDNQFTEEDMAAFRSKEDAFRSTLQQVMHDVGRLRREYADSLSTLRENEARDILIELTRDIEADFPEPSVAIFLSELVSDAAARSVSTDKDQGDYTVRYAVNILVTHNDQDTCPIVLENTPTMANLLGTINRKIDRQGVDRSDHTMIRPGALLRADGGFLILEARDILAEQGAWKSLVRTLRTGQLETVPPEMVTPWWTPSLKPQPIDINVKVILLGDADTYYMLDGYDPDFPNLFKVLADFDSSIPRTRESVDQYVGVLSRIIHDEALTHFDASGVAAMIEHGARIASRQDRLTTRFGRLADIAREASFVAKKTNTPHVRSEEVKTAIRNSKLRANLPSRRFRERLADGTIRIATQGHVVGQINGLAVTQAGPLTSGFPVRLTASIGPGAIGIVNIEREAQLSGAIHTKGFYILGGLLRKLLRTIHPLTFHASIAFEQSYGGIDGDSASGAEVCCLLSALTELPIRQDLAMTGAIDQVGHIQSIGAVNEKIEGFFDTCQDVGLTGTQGVVIPKTNSPDLMLRDDVVEACAQGQFAIHAVDTVHEALEILTGVQAGIPGEDGEYPPNSLLGIAVDRAFEYWVRVSQSGFVQAGDDPTEESDTEE